MISGLFLSHVKADRKDTTMTPVRKMSTIRYYLTVQQTCTVWGDSDLSVNFKHQILLFHFWVPFLQYNRYSPCMVPIKPSNFAVTLISNCCVLLSHLQWCLQGSIWSTGLHLWTVQYACTNNAYQSGSFTMQVASSSVMADLKGGNCTF